MICCLHSRFWSFERSSPACAAHMAERQSVRRREETDAPPGGKKLRNHAAPIDSLPLDVLCLILSSFPVRARLRCASRVCRRWRTAALRSVTSLTFATCAAANLGPLLQLFPSVTQLDVRRRTERPAALPLTLRRLALEVDIGQDSMNLVASAPLPALVRHLSSFYIMSCCFRTERSGADRRECRLSV